MGSYSRERGDDAMTDAPVIYRLECQGLQGDGWIPVVDERRQPITFSGPSGKAKAKNMATLMIRWPSFYALRVQRGSETVWQWERKA